MVCHVRLHSERLAISRGTAGEAHEGRTAGGGRLETVPPPYARDVRQCR
ncbi:hypothetical protein ACFFX0_10705 [Citricoccus parietis]|uniref:Uncharacterized protein n=1 Tax=Citricoccus parietis TaxID=592307 RepID=A0ABV5FZ03_9MICC